MTWAEYRRVREVDLKGRRGRVLRRVCNKAGHVLNEGALVTIRGKANGLELETEPCEHCKQSMIVRGIDPNDVEVGPRHG